jgi:hypothetical protein
MPRVQYIPGIPLDTGVSYRLWIAREGLDGERLGIISVFQHDDVPSIEVSVLMARSNNLYPSR